MGRALILGCFTAAALATALLAPACGDDDSTGMMPDGGMPLTCPAPAATAPGGTCDTGDNACVAPAGSDLQPLCINNNFPTNFPAAGYCALIGCVLDNDCPDGTFCGRFQGSGICFPRCCEEAGQRACADGFICASAILGEELGGFACVPGNPAAQDGDACASIGDCNRSSVCQVDNAERPGGFCETFGCRNDADCASDQSVCVDREGFGVCHKRCTADSDCRAAEGYRCGLIDGQQVCTHGDIGDPCTAAAECGLEPTWSCRTGDPDGYCSIACDAGLNDCSGADNCFDPAGPEDPYCTEACDQGTGEPCRAGYVCAQVTTVGGAKFGCVPD